MFLHEPSPVFLERLNLFFEPLPLRGRYLGDNDLARLCRVVRLKRVDHRLVHLHLRLLPGGGLGQLAL